MYIMVLMVGQPSIYTLAQACSFSGGYINEHLGATGSRIQASYEQEMPIRECPIAGAYIQVYIYRLAGALEQSTKQAKSRAMDNQGGCMEENYEICECARARVWVGSVATLGPRTSLPTTTEVSLDGAKGPRELNASLLAFRTGR